MENATSDENLECLQARNMHTKVYCMDMVRVHMADVFLQVMALAHLDDVQRLRSSVLARDVQFSRQGSAVSIHKHNWCSCTAASGWHACGHILPEVCEAHGKSNQQYGVGDHLLAHASSCMCAPTLLCRQL